MAEQKVTIEPTESAMSVVVEGRNHQIGRGDALDVILALVIHGRSYVSPRTPHVWKYSYASWLWKPKPFFVFVS